jgi:hypothetical protein
MLQECVKYIKKMKVSAFSPQHQQYETESVKLGRKGLSSNARQTFLLPSKDGPQLNVRFATSYSPN